MSLESHGGMILTGENRRTGRKTCPSATLSTTNPTWIDPGENTGLRCERPATNDLSPGTVRVVSLLRWEDAIIVGPKEMQGEDIDCIKLVQIIVQ
jgi:hypothetical protein